MIGVCWCVSCVLSPADCCVYVDHVGGAEVQDVNSAYLVLIPQGSPQDNCVSRDTGFIPGRTHLRTGRGR